MFQRDAVTYILDALDSEGLKSLCRSTGARGCRTNAERRSMLTQAISSPEELIELLRRDDVKRALGSLTLQAPSGHLFALSGLSPLPKAQLQGIARKVFVDGWRPSHPGDAPVPRIGVHVLLVGWAPPIDDEWEEPEGSPARADLIALACCAIALAWQDGPLQRSEVTTIRERLTQDLLLDAAALEELRRHLKEADGLLRGRGSPQLTAEDLRSLVRRVLSGLGDGARLTQCWSEFLVDFLCAVAAADGPINLEERTFIESLAATLGIGVHVVSAAWARWAPPSPPPQRPATRNLVDWALKILGLSPGPTRDAIRAAYRALVLLHHPDRAGPSSTEKMKDINEAYRVLMADCA